MDTRPADFDGGRGRRAGAGLRRGLLVSAALAFLSACSAGEGGSDPAPTNGGGDAGVGAQGVFVAPEARSLSIDDVKQVLAQAIAEAEARGLPSVIAVTDRVGNVLAVYRMAGASPNQQLTPGPSGRDFDAQGIQVPREMAAISKALTGAYLSSAGNAFTSRTASQIVQEHFPPSQASVGLESGPLFGVQFSQLPCSDLVTRYAPGGGVTIGPKRAPLGLSADPGGLPLYKDGVLVGGVGVSGDAEYGFDPEILDIDTDDEELIAVAGMAGFAPRDSIRANRISVDGTTLRFVDREAEALMADPAAATDFDALSGAVGGLVPVPGYFAIPGAPTIIAGQAFGAEASGIRPATAAEFSNPDAFVLSDGAGANRFPIRAGTDGGALSVAPLSETEVRTLLEEAFGVMSEARGQIRRPLNSRAQVSISIVDTNGAILGVVRAPDAPIFGIDVSLQKARTAAFFSGPDAASDLAAANRNPTLAGPGMPDPNVRAFVGDVRAFLSDPAALTGTAAFADRSGGNLARPYFPDGEVGTANGPLSRPIEEWSIFATGLQSTLIVENIAQHIGFVTSNLPGGPPGPGLPDTRARCSFIPDVVSGPADHNRLQNGIQIFPGSVPIYRGDTLIGGIGVSGDGIDQDDMISFLGLHRAGERIGGINNAAPEIRADNIVIEAGSGAVRLRYVNCPFNPFVGSGEQNVCDGL